MFQITINEKGGQAAKSLDFDKTEITIGRVQGNDIVLAKGNISKRHSRIVLKDGKFIIIDMQSTNGTYVNGKKITTPQVVKSTDKIYIGDFTLQLSNAGGDAAAPSASGAKSRSATAAEAELELEPPGPLPDAGSGKGGAGLVEDDFDKEFDNGDAADDAPRTAQPAKVPSPPSSARKKPEPEPELDLNLDAPGPAADDDGLDLSGGLDAPEPEPPKPVKPTLAKGKAPVPTPTPPVPPPAPPKPATSIRGGKPLPPPKKKEEPEIAQEDTPPPKPAPVPEPPPSAPPAPLTPQGLSTDSLLPNISKAPPSPVLVPSYHPPAGLAHAPAAPAPGGAVPVAAVAAAQPLPRAELLDRLQRAIIDELALRGSILTRVHERQAEAEAAARRQLERMRASGLVAADESVDTLAALVAASATDLEPLRELLEDETVLEIVVGPTGEIFAEREGQLGGSERRFASEDEVVAMVRRLALLSGATVDGPLVDLRLRDGSRLVATLPPLSFRGPTFSIRKTTREAFTLDALAQQGTLSEGMQKVVEYAVRYRKGTLLVVGPGVGASATLNAIASVVPVDERIVTVESGVEIHVQQTHAVSLDPSKGVPLERLLAHAAALQPDRAIIGHMSGDLGEVVSAIAGPLEGSVACYAAAGGEPAVDRLAHEIAGENGAIERARQLIARAFPLIVYEQRFADGSRRITEMSEVHLDAEGVVVEPMFVFEVDGVDGNGLISGNFKATGYRPRFLDELNERGLEIDLSMFSA